MSPGKSPRPREVRLRMRDIKKGRRLLSFNCKCKNSCSGEGFSSKFPQEERLIRNLEQLFLSIYGKVDLATAQGTNMEGDEPLQFPFAKGLLVPSTWDTVWQTAFSYQLLQLQRDASSKLIHSLGDSPHH